MSIEAVLGILITINLLVVGGLASLLIAHLKECGHRQEHVGKVEGKFEILMTEVANLRRTSHRHTASIGKLAHKAGVELKDE